MRKIFLSFLAVASLATANAQNPRTAFNNATVSLDIYTTDRTKVDALASAMEDIDFAVSSDQTSGEAKYWRYRGQIYNLVAFDAKLKMENKDAGLKALESFTKAWDLEVEKLNTKGKPITKIPAKVDFKEGFEAACRALYNSGADAYNAQDYQLAYDCFTGILTIRPKTSEGLAKKPVNLTTVTKIDMEQDGARLGGMAAIQLGMPEKGEKLLMPLLEEKKMSEELIPTTYSMIATAYQKAGNVKKASEILAKARKEYPANQSLLIAEINIALAEGKLAELEGKLKQAVEGDKENVELHFVLGNVYDGLFREKVEAGDKKLAKDFFEKAVVWYGKGLEIDAKHFNSAYSLGAIYVNYSNTFAKEMNDIIDMKDPKLKELEKVYMELLDKGLVHLLTAEEINGDDLGTAIALKEVYGRKDDEGNYMKYKAKVEALQKK